MAAKNSQRLQKFQFALFCELCYRLQSYKVEYNLFCSLTNSMVPYSNGVLYSKSIHSSSDDNHGDDIHSAHYEMNEEFTVNVNSLDCTKGVQSLYRKIIRVVHTVMAIMCMCK